MVPASKDLVGEDLGAGASSRALIHLFAELERARLERDSAAERMSSFAHTIQVLIDCLPPAQKVPFQRRFEEIRTGATPQTRGGEVYGSVVALFKRDRRGEWSVPEILSALDQAGQSPDTKALYNAINYLAKTGRIERLSRGRYIVKTWGIGLETDQEIPGADHGTTRATEHDW